MSDTIPDSIPQKQCTKCERLLPHTHEYFNYHDKAANKLYPRCRDCCHDRWRQEHPQKLVVDIPKEKRCPDCNNIFPATRRYFHAAQTKRDGLQTKCKACTKIARRTYYEISREEDAIRQKTYREAHPEYNKSRLVNYRKENPERYRVYNHNRGARKKAVPGTLTQEQIQQKLKAQHYRCYYGACGYAKFEKVNGQYVYHLEHTVPVSRTKAGPRHDVDYVVLACPACNMSKHDKLPHEWPDGGRLL